MNKKEKQELILNEKNNIESSINRNLLLALGYDVDGQGFVIDQETFQRVKYKKKNLKFRSPETSVAHHSSDIIMNPFVDKTLAEKFFTTFLAKEQEENGLYIKMYYPVAVGDKTIIEAIIENSGTIQSEAYKLPSFSFIELILSMSGSYSTQSVYIEQLSRLEEIYSYDL